MVDRRICTERERGMERLREVKLLKNAEGGGFRPIR
jgi:hypothetical protein